MLPATRPLRMTKVICLPSDGVAFGDTADRQPRRWPVSRSGRDRGAASTGSSGTLGGVFGRSSVGSRPGTVGRTRRSSASSRTDWPSRSDPYGTDPPGDLARSRWRWRDSPTTRFGIASSVRRGVRVGSPRRVSPGRGRASSRRRAGSPSTRRTPDSAPTRKQNYKYEEVPKFLGGGMAVGPWRHG